MTPRSPTPLTRVRRLRRGAGAIAALTLICATASAAGAPPDVLRVGLVAGTPAAGPLREALNSALSDAADPAAAITLLAAPAGHAAGLAALRSTDVAVILHGPGAIGAEDVAALREFLRAGRGVVVLGATAEAWAAVPEFLADHLGASPAGIFAKGAAMTVINLLPHPIFAGVTTFDTAEAMPRWEKLAGDAQLFMEGTVGEETTPLAWVRRRANGRLCHFVPTGPALFADSAYRRLLANAVRWAGARAIPGARPIVQRTFMPESHPGAFAITFPRGPGVCLDPVRGGINYLWDGDFVDLRPRWLTKQGEPARIFGEIFYREQEWQPLRPGAPDRVADWQFRGYALTPDGPEFRYQIDGREVAETITATADGAGLVRRFRVGAGRGPLWINLEAQPQAVMRLTGLERDGARAVFASPAAGEFTIEIRRRPADPIP
jgi:type 1 glutamine amidotransferase